MLVRPFNFGSIPQLLPVIDFFLGGYLFTQVHHIQFPKVHPIPKFIVMMLMGARVYWGML